MHADNAINSIRSYLLQLFSGEPLSALPGLKKFSSKNFKKCGRFLIKLLLTSFSFSLIWLSSSMFVAFDFDLNAVAGGVVAVALAYADEPRQALCEPNNPIMSNSCRIKSSVESDRCRMRLNGNYSQWALHYFNHSAYVSRRMRSVSGESKYLWQLTVRLLVIELFPCLNNFIKLSQCNENSLLYVRPIRSSWWTFNWKTFWIATATRLSSAQHFKLEQCKCEFELT